ncbi:Sialidase [Microdochium trichocladiopsis]|uniref:Sialidase n=1 Tax=Microdochium trichocladiopsis TaxID=1682393 RepID=A0A9P8Y9I7_9PEZI|nr:Sialidase [Microdochium trichocladiopsis]KAH7033664.1 Sialidase [Microdochium trichocladiopsis]
MLGKFLFAALLVQPLFAAPTTPHEPGTDCPADPPGPPGGPGGPGGPPGGPGGPPGGPGKPKPWGFFTNNTIYQTTGSEAITYPRYAELEDSTILATASLMGHSPGYFPVFESKDGGASWKYISNLTDQVNGWGMSAQPAITELTEDLGKYKKGTILAGGNSWSNNGTRIDLYASTNRGRSWEFVSHVASGGRPNTTNGATPVWEPYFMVYNHQLVCYYSDQRDPKHGQKLSHQTSRDLVHWSAPVDDVAYDEYIARPGMTVVAYIKPTKKWILVHEFPVGNSSSHGSHYPVYYRLADSPLDFRHSEGLPIVIDGSFAPNASPYVVWSPLGGPFGTIVVSDADNRQVYTNRFGGDVNKWESHATPAGAVYSRAIQIFKKRPDHLMIYGGETFDDFGLGLHTPFSATVINLNDLLKSKP